MEKTKKEWTHKRMPYGKGVLLMLNTQFKPDEIIELINNLYPELTDLCYYDDENKCLGSKDIDKATFHYDNGNKFLIVAHGKKAINISIDSDDLTEMVNKIKK